MDVFTAILTARPDVHPSLLNCTDLFERNNNSNYGSTIRPQPCYQPPVLLNFSLSNPLQTTAKHHDRTRTNAV
jgi:hypothetical protein